MAVILVTLSLLGAIAGLIYLYLTWNFNYWKKRGIKGFKPKIIYGTLPSAITQKRNMIYDYLDQYNAYKKTNKFIGGFSSGRPELIILAPDVAKQVYISKFKQFCDNYMGHVFDSKMEPVFSLNPFMLKGQEWKEKRSEITPALTINRIKASYPIMQRVCSKMVEFLKQQNQMEGKNCIIDCRNLSQRFTIQNVSDCIYGIEAGAFDINKECEMFKQAMNLLNGLMDGVKLFFVLQAIPFCTKIFSKKLLFPETELFFKNLMQDAIQLRKTTNQKERVDFLNYLIQLKEKKGLSDLELQAHTITFFLDGYETSATVLSHAILSLGRHKDVQDKLRREIEQNSDEYGTIGFDKLIELPYLDQCINETLRLFPPAGFSQKVCVEDTELINSDGKSFCVEKGTCVSIPIYAFHTDEEFFQNPEKFDPERFSLENGGEKKYRDMGIFMPFGDGPRICLGQKFALAQVKIALCELARNFEITVNDKTRKDNLLDPKNLLLYLDGGVWCSFNELKN